VAQPAGPDRVPGQAVTAPGPPVTPAIGPVPALTLRSVLVRITAVVCLLALGVLVRNSGGLSAGADDRVPPIPGAALVTAGVLRGASPSDHELAQLHSAFDVGAVVALGGAGVEEQAVARDLGVRVLEIDVDAAANPSPEQLLEVVGFVRDTRAATGRSVYLHDATGAGPALIVSSAMLQVLDDPAAASGVLDRLPPADRAALGPTHVTAVEALVAVVERRASPDNPYSPLEEVAR
jgi:hypothetical protein